MFKKLLSNLPFNPSLIHQVAFYGKRMKQESAIRRTAFVFMSLTMIVQFFAVISPPQSTLAESDNDIVRGGFTSREAAYTKCHDNVQNYQVILNYYHITCDIIKNANPTVQRLNSRALNGQLHSLGRNPVSATNPKTGKTATALYSVDIPNVGQTLYMKNLWYWDSGTSSTYNAIEVANTEGVQMWLLMDCGNIVTLNQYVPPQKPVEEPKKPEELPQELSCSTLQMNVPNDSKLKLGDLLQFQGQASGVHIKTGELVDMYYEMHDTVTNAVLATQKVSGLGFTDSVANDPNVHTFSTQTPGDYTFRLIVKYDGSSKVAAKSGVGNCAKHVVVQKSCPNSKDSKDLENCLDEHKTSFNLTQGNVKGDSTTAKANDEIQYNLTITNTGSVTISKYDKMQENLSDVLDYADVTDLGGGTMGANHVVTWPAFDIKGKETVQKSIKLKMKPAIPSTPVSTSDAGKFDCIMTNVFGDSINIKVDCPVIKTIETTTTLPSTGPGSSIAIGFVVTAIIGYFFARARLFAKELDIVRVDFGQSGEI